MNPLPAPPVFRPAFQPLPLNNLPRFTPTQSVVTTAHAALPAPNRAPTSAYSSLPSPPKAAASTFTFAPSPAAPFVSAQQQTQPSPSPRPHLVTDEGPQPNLSTPSFHHRLPSSFVPSPLPQQTSQHQPNPSATGFAISQSSYPNAASLPLPPQNARHPALPPPPQQLDHSHQAPNSYVDGSNNISTMPGMHQASNSAHPVQYLQQQLPPQSSPQHPYFAGAAAAGINAAPSLAPPSFAPNPSNSFTPTANEAPILPREQQSYGSYCIYASQPPRFAFIKPVDPSHVALSAASFPVNADVFTECALPFGVVMNPLTAGLSPHPLDVPGDPAAQALLASSTASNLVSPAQSGLNTPMHSSSSPNMSVAASPVHQSQPSAKVSAFNFNNFAVPDAGAAASEIPIIRPGPASVIRCNDCKAYLNGYVQFYNQGKNWRCNLCQVDNSTPTSFYSPLQNDGRRVDWEERDELKHASYEIHAPRDYMVRAPVPPLICFVIDVGRAAQQCGYLADLCATIVRLIEQIATHPKTLMSVLTYSDVVHFYAISTKGKGAVMHVMPAIDDVFLPVPIGLLIRVADCKAQLIALFQSLVAMHAPKAGAAPLPEDSCFSAALESAQCVMGRYGGRVLAFTSARCSMGKGALADRQRDLLDAKDADAAIKAMRPQANDHYKRISDLLQKHQMTVDIFAMPPSLSLAQGLHPLRSPQLGRAPLSRYLDVATISEVARFTGGAFHYLPHYDAALMESSSSDSPLNAQRQSFADAVERCVMQPQCFESVFRVRVSKGLLVNDFHGHFTIRGSSLLAIPSCDAPKSISFELALDASDKSALAAYKERHAVVQTGLLYTSFMGERRITVHTLVMPLQSHVARLLESLNVSAAISVMSKRAVWLAYAHSARQARDFIKQKAATVHRAIVKTGSSSPALRSASQQFDYLTFCMFRSLAYRDVDGVGSPATYSLDEAAANLSRLYIADIGHSLPFLSPTLIALHDLWLDPRLGALDESHQVIMPQSLPLALSSLSVAPTVAGAYDANGHSSSSATATMFLLYSGFDVYIRLGNGLSPDLVREIFGAQFQSVHELPVSCWPAALGCRSPLQHETHLIARLSNVMSQLFAQCALEPPCSFRVFRENDASEHLFFSYLINDRRGKDAGLQDWQEWLQESR